jgi:hypothetical protein
VPAFGCGATKNALPLAVLKLLAEGCVQTGKVAIDFRRIIFGDDFSDIARTAVKSTTRALLNSMDTIRITQIRS